MAAAAATAVGVIGAAYLSHRAANNAAKKQKQAADEALSFEREQNQYIRSRYEKEESREDEARRLYQQYLASNSRGQTPGQVQLNYSGAPPAGQTGGDWRAAQMGAQPTTLRDLAAGTPAAPVEATPDQAGSMADVSNGQGGTLRDVAEWNDWRGLGLGN